VECVGVESHLNKEETNLNKGEKTGFFYELLVIHKCILQHNKVCIGIWI